MASDEAQRAFIERGGAKLPPREGKTATPSSSKNRQGLGRKEPLKRRRRPRPESDRQKVRSAFLAGIKAERIAHQLLTEGRASCERCPTYWTTFASAKGHLDLHHTEKRSRGPGYRDGNMGVDAPRLLEMLCRECHREQEQSEPEWTKGQESA